MEDDALYALARGSAMRALVRQKHYVDLLAAREDRTSLLTAQLAEGQFDCGTQLRTVAIFAMRCVLPVIGREWTLPVWDGDAASLRAQNAHAARAVAAITRADFDGAATAQVRHKAGDAILTQGAEDYLVTFAIPNLWFHLATAHSILRAQGVAVGKADFDGLHAYPDGFSFV